MGWYHAIQLIEGKCPSATLAHIVEPWFLGGGASGPGGAEFATFVAANPQISFHSSLATLPLPSSSKPRLVLISGRTADNPRLLTECIALGVKTIYLEKPGAPTVAELDAMSSAATASNVSVLMGYNKNVCKYVRKVRENFASNETPPNSFVTFVTNNAYEPSDASLGECFERNREGMLKNMAIHELCLLVSFFDVTVENIAKVEVDKSFSSMKSLKGPSGDTFTDFDKIKFKIFTKAGAGKNGVSVQADRCGGETSWATVSDASSGKESFRWSMPDEEDEANVEKLKKKYPDAMPYFFSQDPDYITVKERVAKTAADGSVAEGIATIKIACETMRVAEWLKEECEKQL
ncbi:hypothetical protein ScalyP_jg10461 [Parmales sp. scaly parma]|nr:hypothetical protein ScalyP_jg10461 [Parmales sp. scaly parma]